MSKAKKPYAKQAFESVGMLPGNNADSYATIYDSMMLSAAWLDLSAAQVRLYLACKAQLYGKKKPPEGWKTFYMNQAIWMNKYKLYAIGRRTSFYRDMDQLIAHGFITCAERGAATRTRSVYEFSDKWQTYGKDPIKVSATVRDRISRRDDKKDCGAADERAL